MSDPLIFDSATPRFALPLLYAGQAQKEAFVNEALERVDAILHCCISGETTTPPTAANDGDAWIVGATATGDWAEHDGALAIRQGGGWTFIAPRDGMRVYDQAARQERFFAGAWKKATLPVELLGGSTVDGEARAAIIDLVSALQALGIFPTA
ncbi:hypothetical protein WSK_3180 [Novosphingobium sp. Rr 2-17]|uniref:DUF2793 domain-containing protein n=1 Tax=Novosphingobium sp. Rr 2-17 TaxID=555793 RepID=UPI0002698569|nr:DUF2793 domain-containing protein [Novosphingobium sp. Rr 2-17]EIZ78298.1 hypothetical protein WSK_3180 [Novosphingobium sp. Rr 2-17]